MVAVIDASPSVASPAVKEHMNLPEMIALNGAGQCLATCGLIGEGELPVSTGI